MVLPAIIAGAAALGSAALNNYTTNKRINEENKKADQAISGLTFSPDDYYTNYDYYSDPLLYDTYQLQDTEYSNVNIDPTVLAAQRQALDELINLSESNGLSSIDQQALQEIVNSENANLKGQNDALIQEAMQRGVYGSGLELANRLQNAQSAANRMNSQDMNIMSEAQKRALDALSSYGNLASSMRGQDYSEQAQRAAAQDVINQANWQNRQTNANANIDSQNRVSQLNTDVQHKQQDSNVQAARDIYGNKVDKVSLQTNQYAGNKQDAKDREDSLNKLLGTGISAFSSAYNSSK